MPAVRQIRSHAALRGVAALLVVAYHLQFGATYRFPFETATGFFRRSYLAVDLFFVLSGFIISYVNDAERRTAVSPGEMASFLRARLARLYPLHLFCLAYMVASVVAMALAERIAGNAGPLGAHPWQPVTLLLQLLLLNAWAPGLEGWNIPSWSISAEMAAYLLFPALVSLHARRARGTELAMLAGACAFLLWIALTTGNLDIIGGLAPARCLAGFMLGMLVYYRRGIVVTMPAALLSLLQLTSIAAIFASLAIPSPDPLVIPAFVLLVATTWTDRGLLPALLARRPLLWLGDISYSIYLNHVPLMGMIAFAWSRIAVQLGLGAPAARGIEIGLVFATVLVVSQLTYDHVERPARQWLARRWLHRSAPPIETSPAAP